jgi:repressor LexA
MSPYTPEGETRDKVYRFVRRQLESGRSPTLREVQAAFGFAAVETVRKHLAKLVAAGRLGKVHGARGYCLPDHERVALLSRRVVPKRVVPRRVVPKRVVPKRVVPKRVVPKRVVMVPLLGRVPAGGLEEAIEDHEWSIPAELPSRGARGDQLFALRVEGESMQNVGILDGDIVIVHAQSTARSGEIVVAMVGDEATVKTLRRRVTGEGVRRVELHPENPRFEPIVPAKGAEFRILGRVVEVRRQLG